jgi:hypothetical protein
MSKVVIVKVDGTVKDCNLENLQQIQKSVGGWIELIRVGKFGSGFVNEEGKLKGLPINVLATFIWHKASPTMKGDFLVGDVVFCGNEDQHGNTKDIKKEFASFINEMREKLINIC